MIILLHLVAGMILLCRCWQSKTFRSQRRLTEEQDTSNGAYYYINLARRDDRKAKLEQTISSSSPRLWQKLERIDAIDGQTLSLDDEERLRPFVTGRALQEARNKKAEGLATLEHHKGDILRFNEHLTEGGVACAMSHYRALEAVASHPTADWGLILEDDIAAAVPHADRALDALIAKLPYDWDAVLLGYHDDNGTLADGDGQNVSFYPLTEKRFGLYSWLIRKALRS
eukprot:gnl/TRDRNA2_/TRDRNA2_167404_c0_seq3.p1 gnl/TRDRNA2_/TRDRNA2_167404_c0~~gnl/TRDRNA2_/TRDRNA2_167404_c0_seq3.p1  ORF type:complete len:228 (+),score=28.40 gnl/TRDRNA2_/TRDRNA2_167404_c0_seq3:2-685(+)